MQSLEEIKSKILKYNGNIKFNEPHFSIQLKRRSGKRNEVIDYLKNPSELTHYYIEKGKYFLYFPFPFSKVAICDLKELYSKLVN